jgi:hypothetical protein
VAGRDITEGRGTRSIAIDLGIGTGSIWQNTGVQYDFAIGGLPFLAAISDQHPYERATAQFRKNQFDSLRDPGEQSLSTWWLRSQSSFHTGTGINFYDPFANPYSPTLGSNSYRYNKSLGVEVFDVEGQVTLLRKPTLTQSTTAATELFAVQVSGADRILMHDGATLKLTDGTTSAMTTLSSGVATTIYAACADGTNAYYIDAAHIVSVPLTGGATSAVRNVSVTGSAKMAYVKERLIVGIDNKIYEMPATGGGGALPTPLYTHPNPNWVWTGIDEGSTAIYASGYVGTQSSVVKFTLDATGALPVLTSAITAAVVPDGEIIHNIHIHLMSYIIIATNKGARVGTIDGAGNINYGGLMIDTEYPIRGMASHDSYVYLAGTFDKIDSAEQYPGLYIINLGTEISAGTLQFAYATFVYADTISSGSAISVCHLGTTNNVAFTVGNLSQSTGATANQGLFVQSSSLLYTSGYLQTGYIRYNTLEKKNFKRVVGRGDYTYGSMSIATYALDGNVYDVISYDSSIGNPESTITQPVGGQDALGLRFTLYKDATDGTNGPVFKGYQLKAVPASPRTRMIKIPLLCYDTDTDKYNATVGYEGYAYEKLAALEDIEASGDVVTWQDFRTGETTQCLIEEVTFTDITPPDKKLTGFGGIVSLTIRTV